jgi:hypothetical protein
MATPNTSIIFLSTGTKCIVDTENYDILMRHDWQERPDDGTSYAWRQERIKGIYVGVAMHRVITDCPADRVVDHIDGNGLNNVKSNLRIVTRAINDLNRKKRVNSSSNYIGVSLIKKTGKWRASGTDARWGTHHTISEHHTEIAAALAYNEFCRRYNPFSRLNQISEGTI